jgi:Zn finger protein HypA/HybF involved in hydrogenase expression
MNEADLRLDGNAVAGLLTEVFAVEMTTAVGTCAHCGASNAIGAVQVYAQAPGTVLRCPSCASVLMTIVRARDQMHVDISGTRRFELAVSE